MPAFVVNEVRANAFEQRVATSVVRGDALNITVLSILALLGVSLWFLSDTLSRFTTGSLLDLLCTVSGNGGCSDISKNKVAIAALAWILGNVFFSQVLVDDMTSSITVPDNSHIPELQDCQLGTGSTHAGTVYYSMNSLSLLAAIQDTRSSIIKFAPIVCASDSEADDLRRYFDFQNLCRIRLRSYGLRYFIKPEDVGVVNCPAGIVAARGRVVDSFVDNSGWNGLAVIASRFDLLKHLIRESQRILFRSYKKRIERKLGCCRRKDNTSKAFSRFLSKFKFVCIGCCVALCCFVIEFMPRVWSERGAVFPRFERLFCRCRFRQPSRRVGPLWF